MHLGELAALSTALMWTISTLFMTYAGKQIGALVLCTIRIVLACGLMMLCDYAMRGQWFPVDASPRTWTILGISGIFGFFLCDICWFKSLILLGPRLTLLIQSLTPPMAAILSWLCINDRLEASQWAAMGVTLAGVAWVVFEQPNGDPHPPGHRKAGIALAVMAAMAQAIGLMFSKKGMGDYDHAVAATLIRALVALPCFIVLMTATRRWPAVLAGLGRGRAMMALGVGTSLGPFLGVVMYMVALSNAPTGVVATIIGIMPVLILPFSVFLYREKIGHRAIVGAILAVVGVAMLALGK